MDCQLQEEREFECPNTCGLFWKWWAVGGGERVGRSSEGKLKAKGISVAQVAVCYQINTKHINTVWAERTIVEC
jgi:hypothetical protein